MDVEAKFETGWRRFFAGIFDGIILSLAIWPFTYFFPTGSEHIDQWFADISGILYVVLVTFYLGATIGKRCLGLEVVDCETERKINLRQSFLRESGTIAIFLIGIFVTIFLPHVSDANPLDEEYIVRQFIELGFEFWFGLELLTMVTNKKRRAIHDFIAGTVVINKREKKFAEILATSKRDTD